MVVLGAWEYKSRVNAIVFKLLTTSPTHLFNTMQRKINSYVTRQSTGTHAGRPGRYGAPITPVRLRNALPRTNLSVSTPGRNELGD